MNSAQALDDCRCAALGGDDADAVSGLYPLTTPPSVTTPTPLPDATVGVPYEYALAAIGGTEAFTWSFASDGSNPVDDFGPGLAISPDGVLSGMPIEPSFPAPDRIEDALIRATDSNGDFHTKRFFIRINPAAVTTTTVTSTTSSTGLLPTVPAPFPCETTTTTIALSSCDLATGFIGVECKVGEGRQLVSTLPRGRAKPTKLLTRILHRSERARGEIDRKHGGMRSARRLLRDSEHAAVALGELSRRPRFVGTVGVAKAEALGALGDVLTNRLRVLRATISGAN